MVQALNDFRLWAFLRLNGFSDEVAKTLVKVARLETDHYESRGWQQAYNPFGMGAVRVRQTTQLYATTTQDGNGLGWYSSLWSAVRDYAMWFDYWGLSKSELRPSYWENQNPKPAYRETALAVSDSLRRGKTIAMVIVPLTYLAVTSALKLMK